MTTAALAAPVGSRARVATDVRRLLPVLVGAIAALAGILAIAPHPVGVFQDDGMYLVLARALAEGEGYRYIHLPGAPAGTHFPPAYPALLALLSLVGPAFPANVLLFKAANAILNALAAVLAYRVGVRQLQLPPWLAATAATLCAIGLPSMMLAAMLLSEPLFLVLLLVALPLAERLRTMDAPPARLALGVGVLCGLLTLTRSIGIALCVAVPAVLLIERRWKVAAVVIAGAALLLVPWNAWVALHDAEIPAVLRGKYGSYSGWLSGAVARHGIGFVVETAARNAVRMASTLTDPIRLGYGPAARVAALLLGGALLAGGAVRAWRRLPVLVLFAVAYFGIVLVWPFDPTRFVFGVWPLVGLLMATGVAWGLEARRAADEGARWRPVLAHGALVAGAVVALGAGMRVAGTARSAAWSAIPRAREVAARPVLDVVAAATDPRDIVVSDEETMVFLYTGRRGVPAASFSADEYLHPPTPDERGRALEAILTHYRPTVVVLTGAITMEGARALTTRAPERLRFIGRIHPFGALFRPTFR